MQLVPGRMREEILPEVALVVLTERYGQSAVDAAVWLETTKGAVEDALRLWARERGLPIGETIAEGLAAIRDAGGISRKPGNPVVRAVYRKGELPDGE